MLFGTKAPLWRYVLGIITLSVMAQRVAAAVMAHLGGLTAPVVAGYGLQAAGLAVAAAGLFAVKNRLVVAGLAVAVAAVAATPLMGGPTVAPMAAFSAFGLSLLVFAGYVLIRRAQREAASPRSKVNRHVLSAEEAENFAARKPQLYGRQAPGDVEVSPYADGRLWRVTMFGLLHDVQPMDEMEWQSWLKSHA